MKNFNKVNEMYNRTSLKVWVRIKATLCNARGAIGSDEIIGIAAGLIIAAFVLIPQLRAFATTIITALSTWWTTTATPRIFPTT